MQDKCSSQAFSTRELEAKLDEDVAQKGELERQLDKKVETCPQTEVFPQTATNLIMQFHVACCMFLHAN